MMTSTLVKWNEKDPPKDSEDGFGEEFKNEISILNQNFLTSIQNELKGSPEACLAPLVMEYLVFLYPLVKSPDSKIPEKAPSSDSVDFLEVAKYFHEVKDIIDKAETKPGVAGSSIVKELGVGDTSSKSFTLPASNETDKNNKAAGSGGAAGPGFFGLLGANNKTPSTSLPESKPSSAVKPSTSNVGTAKPASSLPQSTSSSSSSATASHFKNFSFTAPSVSTTAPESSTALTSVSQPSTSSAISSTSTPGTFSFGAFSSGPKLNTAVAGPSSGSMSLFGSSTLPSSGFGQSGFGSSLMNPAPSFGAGAGSFNGSTEQKKEESDEEDSPPKPDFVPVVESDSLYTEKIRVYEMQKGAYKELGIANLFIKELPGPKHQLVVRADNSLGTILVNVVLNSSIPIRQNKPTNILSTFPNSEGKPTTFLFRVKEESVGNEIFRMLEKYKNS